VPPYIGDKGWVGIRSEHPRTDWEEVAELIACRNSEEALMAIVAGFDVHRGLITFDALDTETGEVSRGRIESTPAAIVRWCKRFAGREVHVALEACTGWLLVCDALVGAGAVAHLAEPVEARALRGRKRRAKTDREDARWLRELLADGRLPEAWIAPEHVRQWRSRARLRHTLIDERTQWFQRIRRDAVLPRRQRIPGETANA
jgi:Transposase